MPDIQEKSTEKEPGIAPSASKRWGSWQLWLGVIFSLGFLWLALHGVDLMATANALRRVNLFILGLAVVSYVFSIVAKAARWQLLLAVHKSPSIGRAFSIFSVGQMLNSFFPAHLGEFARAYLMGEAEADNKVYVLGTVAVERIADLLFLLISLILLLSQMVLPDWLASPARGTTLVMVILVPFFVLLAWQRNFVLIMVERASHLVPMAWREWLVRQAHFGLSSLDALRRPRLLAGLLGWSFIVCLISAFTNYLVLLALGMVLPFWTSLLLLVVLQIGTAVPSSPGRIGVFQYLVILSLSIFSVDKGLALGYSIVLYLVIFVPIALIGGYCFWREKITWQKLTDAAAMFKRLGTRF